MSTTPRIACIAIISRTNSPLHLTTFPPPPSTATTTTATTTSSSSSSSSSSSPPSSSETLKYHFLTHATLDVFQSRLPLKSNGDSDFGLLYSIDEDLAAYGWLTNTGVKMVVIVDVCGGGGVKEGELKAVFRALQTAYIKLVCNPFYENEEARPVASKKFIEEVARIGESWAPGVGP